MANMDLGFSIFSREPSFGFIILLVGLAAIGCGVALAFLPVDISLDDAPMAKRRIRRSFSQGLPAI
ncbi:hypothetical protein BDV23DRAFT_161435 [Aspergillus alliaceus]|uniref:Uncharacterized protein n=1 Tax=Petromyces alliaceus TaxID=209559 RepID=A0A5N7BZP3_PETAA|nr:uncharacterized protein BDW43DRAFT_261305 [Aspergillus alliaceus]KAB8238326.1 hypothetical protein BDW43DRAFT_261305 [Aspergillus alliaceus]KAE8387304.1 hypothetical protein BDV23DRAFT_161435 [Aspergillus alliaceus]